MTYRVIDRQENDRQHWVRTTKAMNIPGGVLILVTTRQRNPGFSHSVVDTVTHVPDVRVHNNAGEWELIAI